MLSKSDREGNTIEAGSPKCSQELSVKKKSPLYILIVIRYTDIKGTQSDIP